MDAKINMLKMINLIILIYIFIKIKLLKFLLILKWDNLFKIKNIKK